MPYQQAKFNPSQWRQIPLIFKVSIKDIITQTARNNTNVQFWYWEGLESLHGERLELSSLGRHFPEPEQRIFFILHNSAAKCNTPSAF